MSLYLKTSHLQNAERLVSRARANGGLAPLNLEKFWVENDAALKDPWGKTSAYTPLATMMSDECIFAELGIPEDWYRLFHDEPYNVGLRKLYNDRAEKIVGRRVLQEWTPCPERSFNGLKQLYDVFEGRNEWQDASYWLHQAANTPDELKALLDRVEKRLGNLREFILPPDWAGQKAQVLNAGGEVPLYRSQRGPITFAMSIYGVENLIYLIMDEPDLAGRFRDLILKAMLGRARILDEEAGHAPGMAPHGWYWADDNCAMLNAEMYEFFGYPILKAVFERYSPDAVDCRGQHSDSDMAQLLPLLGRLNMTDVNLGPKLTVEGIRNHLPRAVIRGQLAPFTFSRNEEVNMVAEFLRDFEMARENRGLKFGTAGSINSGSRLTSMRLLMAAVQEYGRY
jgi:uroporphyrinogen decarboxylase